MRKLLLLPLLLLGLACAGEHEGSLGDSAISSTDDRPAAVEPPNTTRPRPRPTTTTAPPNREPLPADFTITIVETSRQCFGSAGCNIEAFPELTVVTPDELDSAGCTLSYSLAGVSSTSTYSIDLTGGLEYRYDDLWLMTDADVPLTATPTQVVCR